MTDNKHIQTETNEDPYENLDPIYQQAIDMRIDGMRYRAIGQFVKRSEMTVRLWFYKGGRLYDVYTKKKKERSAESKKLWLFRTCRGSESTFAASGRPGRVLPGFRPNAPWLALGTWLCNALKRGQRTYVFHGKP
jgi:hypothetical protein